MSACPLVVLACESLHVCTVCIWRCEHARFCVEGFYALYINFHSFIHSISLLAAPRFLTELLASYKLCNIKLLDRWRLHVIVFDSVGSQLGFGPSCEYFVTIAWSQVPPEPLSVSLCA